MSPSGSLGQRPSLWLPAGSDLCLGRGCSSHGEWEETAGLDQRPCMGQGGNGKVASHSHYPVGAGLEA